MREFIDRILAQTDFHGTALLRLGGERFEAARGYAHKGFCVPNTMNTRFDCASVTKLFTAAAILRLVDEEKLCLTDRITDLIDLSGTKIPTDVSVMQLLNHTSGIADDADEEAGEDYSELFRHTPNYAFRECADFLLNFAFKEPNFPAGTNVRYCNCSYILLGLAIEKLSGKGYRDYVRENVFLPAGMEDAAFLSMDGVNPRLAEGYTDGGTRKNIYSYPPTGTPDGGACISVADIDRFFSAIADGKLFSRETSRFFLEPHCSLTRPFAWNGRENATWRTGCAFEFVEVGGKVSYLYKEGVNAGVSAMVSYHPGIDAVIALLSNDESDVWKIHDAIRDEIHMSSN